MRRCSTTSVGKAKPKVKAKGESGASATSPGSAPAPADTSVVPVVTAETATPGDITAAKHRLAGWGPELSPPNPSHVDAFFLRRGLAGVRPRAEAACARDPGGADQSRFLQIPKTNFNPEGVPPALEKLRITAENLWEKL